jgi:hypothetical protein
MTSEPSKKMKRSYNVMKMKTMIAYIKKQRHLNNLIMHIMVFRTTRKNQIQNYQIKRKNKIRAGINEIDILKNYEKN